MPLTNEDIAVDLDKCPENMDLSTLFGQPGPIEIEIGSGKGTFLLNQAKAHPQTNFLGIEWANKYYQLSVDRMRRWNMTNVRVLRTDAVDFIGRYVPDQAIETVHIYFPDPWPKTRHHKRRFFNPDPILAVHRCLKVGGQLRYATDHAEYFQWTCDIIRNNEKIAPLFQEVDFAPTQAADEGEWVGSNFERKYAIEGRSVYRLALVKK
ncbi:MAG: tRNA (guanosine(46)-N7)-methyltransferase TrmB [Phycisphaerae bacterium]|nr:tRNA (guanosine(46)-N7)-methyltransferase TrmB [Phycisphaerae bacterium]